ncbi:MAG: ABC transporter permease [Deltaproteobacteria bacterium]|nr:ABC transporter permease [Deltaproteobacteria bacterium]
MFHYLVKRLLFIIPTLFGITLITFLIVKMAPGDPLSLKLMFVDGGISPKALAQELAKQEDPLELPGWYQGFVEGVSSEGSQTEKGLNWMGKNTVFYFKWLQNVVTLDFGLSSKDKRPVVTRIKEALPITLALNIITILIVYLISIPLGVWSAMKRESPLDKVIMVKLFILYALPEFWVATILLVFLAGGEYLNWFPLMGYLSNGAENLPLWRKTLDIAWHLVLPVTVYVYGSFAFLSRFSRTNFLEVIRQDYIRTARAKGLPERTVIWKHAFRNSLIPLVTLMGTLLPGLLGGSVIIEQIFSIPGMGMLSFEAVLSRDYNMIMGIATISAFLTLLSLLLSDLMYVWVDPRITFEDKS